MQLHSDVNKIKMYYKRIGQIIRDSIPKDRKPKFTAQQIEGFKTVSGIILGILVVGGLMTLALLAPNAVGAVGKLFLKKYPNRVFTKREKDLKLAQAFYYMKRTGQIKMKFTGRYFMIFLTKRGRRRLEKLQFQSLKIKHQKNWDRKWWQVAADIPTKKYKIAADLFRGKLKNMSFFPLQRTVWFYPFDPRSEVEYISNHYGIGRFVTAMEVSRLDKEDEIRMKAFFKKEKIL